MTLRDLKSRELRSPSARAIAGQPTNWAYRLGFWSASLTTLGGVIYFLVIASALVSGQFVFPPSEAMQLFGGVSSLLICPALVILVACLHTITPAEKKVFSQISLGFTLLFALAVSINRYTQLGVVRQSVASGTVAGVDWFLPYGDHSIMLGLEIMGWGWFLGLALLFTAPLFSNGKLQLWLRGLLILYGGLGLISAVAYLLASPLSVVGFVAWGLILFIITALLAVHFRQAQPTSSAICQAAQQNLSRLALRPRKTGRPWSRGFGLTTSSSQACASG